MRKFKGILVIAAALVLLQESIAITVAGAETVTIGAAEAVEPGTFNGNGNEAGFLKGNGSAGGTEPAKENGSARETEAAKENGSAGGTVSVKENGSAKETEPAKENRPAGETASATEFGPVIPGLEPEPQEPAAEKGKQISDFALQFLGNPYRYGGTSLTKGADCSGFVQSVFKSFGIQLPRTSKSQGQAGTDIGGIENAVPGDVVSYRGHIGIYIGNGSIVHASSRTTGIIVSPVNYKPILSVRRMV